MSRPLRVLYSFPHALGGPGINTTAMQQVAALAESGADLTVYCTSLREAVPPGVRVVETMRVAGRRVPHRALGVQNAYAYHDIRVAIALARSHDRFDAVHCWPSSCLQTIRIARRHGVGTFREVPSAHTALTFEASARASAEIGVELPSGYATRFDARRLRREEKEFVRVDFLLVPSDFVKQSFAERGIEESKMIRHHYGYDPSRFYPAAVRDGERPFTAAFVGRGEPAKGLHIGLRAWLDSPAADAGQFLIVGRILPEYERRLADMLSHPSVRSLGFVSDVGAVLGRTDVLILPSFAEGSALVTFEAMACGAIPLVSTAAGAPIRDGVEGFLHDVGDTQALRGQISKLAADQALVAQMRGHALDASARLTWAHAGQRLLAAYREGLEGSGAAA